MLLVVDRRDSALSREGNALVVRINGERHQSVPLGLLTHLVLSRKTLLDSALLAYLANQGVMISLNGGREQRYSAYVIKSSGTLAQLRQRQYRLADQPAAQQRIVRALVRLKIQQQRQWLIALQQQRADLRYPLHRAIQSLSSNYQKTQHSTDVATLRGLEGASAAQYFAAYAQAFAPSLGFTQRQRRPPPDPVNALLSLGYTLAFHQANQLCQEAGFDPLCGYLHSPSHGRASLAADLVELARCQIDRLCWQLFSEQTLRAHHFEQRDGGCFLNKAGRQIFYSHYAGAQSAIQHKLKRPLWRFRRWVQAPSELE